ncbi:MAG TPA: hypothetical protein VK797_00410 [Tepidisphaeraceae bacterium]|nr:hypothetical protein [Tepidisphaeraceae bacterium]
MLAVRMRRNRRWCALIDHTRQAWQLFSERRRRAGTWYAVTDQRILFVLTRRRPESVIGIEFSELSRISLNNAMEVMGPLDGVILKLNDIDPYMAASGVLGYQVSAKMIFLEDLEDPEEFVKQIVASKMAAAARSGTS